VQRAWRVAVTVTQDGAGRLDLRAARPEDAGPSPG
jgi:hypothetical protein